MTNSRISLMIGLMGVLLILSGCGSNARKRQAISEDISRCTICHGSSDNAAPPRPVDRAGGENPWGVGAHQAHVAVNPIAAPISCSECHIVPNEIDDPGHISDNGVVTVVFGPLATANGATPKWDRSTGTCGSVYCHGSTLASSSGFNPSWNATFSKLKISGESNTCAGSCHGMPPVAPHPQNQQCMTCHPGMNSMKHLNGRLDFLVK